MRCRFRIGLLALLAAGLAAAGCSRNDVSNGGSAETADATKAAAANFPGMEADLQRTLQEQSDFYAFKTEADFAKDTAGLTWEDGSDQPEFADPEAKKGGTFNYYISDFPRTLRTIGPDATGGIREWLLDFVGVPYMKPHPNLGGRVFPGLAQRWALDRKTKTVFMELVPEARWSDGVPVTTDDVVFSFYFMRSPHLNEPWYNDFYTKTYSGLTVYGPHHFAIRLQQFKPDAATRAGDLVPYPKHFFADFGPGWLPKYDWRVIPTTGAYTLLEKDINKGRSVTLTRLDDWWAKDRRFWRWRYNPDRIRLIVIRDPDKGFESLVRGDIDLYPLDLPKHWYDQLPDSHPAVANGYIVKAQFFNRVPRPDRGLWINCSKPVLDNREVREGLHYATNFQRVCDQYFRGDAVVMQTRSDGYTWRMHPTITARPFDPARARELFAQAGFTRQGPDGVLVNDQGRRLSFTITAYLQAHRDILAIVKQEALKAGLEFNIEILDSTTGWKKYQEKQHEIAFAALSRSVELYPRYWEMFHGSNAYEDAYLGPNGQPVLKASEGTPNPHPQKIRVQTNNMTETFDPELDRLIEAYDSAETLDEIKSLAAQMEGIIYHDAFWVNGYALPFYRDGYWRWVKWPKDFNVMQSRYAYEFMVHWIDTELEKDVKAAQREGRTFAPQVLTFAQYKEQ